MIWQDRLGTNVEKVEKKRDAFLSAGDDGGEPIVVSGQARAVKKRVFLRCHFNVNKSFTKTGSGQTGTDSS
jgi:hypothetical protein